MQELLALLRNGLHSLLDQTIQTMEETGRTVFDVTNTGPWECTMDLARQVWDKSRHIEIFLKLLERVEGSSEEYLETTAETSAAGLASDAMIQLIELAQKEHILSRAFSVTVPALKTRRRVWRESTVGWKDWPGTSLHNWCNSPKSSVIRLSSGQ